MKIELPPQMQKMIDENPDLEVLHVCVVFDKKEPMTKKRRKELANSVYQSALQQLEQYSKTFEKISPISKKKPTFIVSPKAQTDFRVIEGTGNISNARKAIRKVSKNSSHI